MKLIFNPLYESESGEINSLSFTLDAEGDNPIHFYSSGDRSKQSIIKDHTEQYFITYMSNTQSATISDPANNRLYIVETARGTLTKPDKIIARLPNKVAYEYGFKEEGVRAKLFGGVGTEKVVRKNGNEIATVKNDGKKTLVHLSENNEVEMVFALLIAVQLMTL